MPFVLALGIWLGGHPQWLLDPVANLLVGSPDRRVSLEALDTLHDKYYREVPEGALSDAPIAGPVRHLDDRFSAYLSDKEFHLFQNSLDNAFEGVGRTIPRPPRAPPPATLTPPP